jgi:hypothetical protein
LAIAGAMHAGSACRRAAGEPLVAAASGRRFELVLSNPPYIAEGDPHLPALAHEPHSALVVRPATAWTPSGDRRRRADHLAPGGWLLLEHGHDQAEPVRTLLAPQASSTFRAAATWPASPAAAAAAAPRIGNKCDEVARLHRELSDFRARFITIPQVEEQAYTRTQTAGAA